MPEEIFASTAGDGGACHFLNGGELLGPGPPQRDCPGRGTAWPPAEIPPGVCPRRPGSARSPLAVGRQVGLVAMPP